MCCASTRPGDAEAGALGGVCLSNLMHILLVCLRVPHLAFDAIGATPTAHVPMFFLALPGVQRLHLPRGSGHNSGVRVKNGANLADQVAGAFRDAIAAKIATPPEHLLQRLACDQGAELA